MKILIVEDSNRLRHILHEGLRREGFAVDCAENGVQALDHLKSYHYDVMLLDLMMPEMDGYSLLKTIRTQGDETFVLVLSARFQVEHRLQALEYGADDYMSKPFSFAELLARIDALIRRKYGQKSPTIAIGPMKINTALKTVAVDEQDIKLTKSEYGILELLALSRGQIRSREAIVEGIYSSEEDIASNVIDVHICSLRRKLAAFDQSKLIRTKKGLGYFIEGQPIQSVSNS